MGKEKQTRPSAEDGEKRKRRSSSPSDEKKTHHSSAEKKRRGSASPSEQGASSASKKMSICEDINKLGCLDDMPPLVKTKSLEINKLYQVDDFKVVISEFGQSVMAFLDESCWIFLPKRLSVRLLNKKNEEELEELEKAATDGTLALRFLGGGKYNKCEFVIKDDDDAAV